MSVTKLELIPCVSVRYTPKRDGMILKREDIDLISDFRKWVAEEKIYPVTRGGTFGGGIYVAYHSAEDAQKIKEWFKERGVDIEEYDE